MKKNLLCLMIFVLLLSVIPVSAQETLTMTSVTVTDDLDREVEIPLPLTSVVTLAPSLTETLYFLDAADLIVGCDLSSDYPEAMADVEKVTNWDTSIIYESVAALEPDLILAAEINSVSQIKDLEDLGMTVFYVKNPTNFEELFDSISLVGQVVDREEEAAALNEKLEARVEAVAEVMEANTETPLVFYELDATDPAKPWTTGSGTFISMIIELAGGKNLGDELEGEWIQIGQEALMAADPDVILLGDYKYGATPEAVAERPGWDEIKAVENGAMFGFDDNLVSRPGPRLVEGLEVIAGLLHPELFDVE